VQQFAGSCEDIGLVQEIEVEQPFSVEGPASRTDGIESVSAAHHLFFSQNPVLFSKRKKFP